MGIQPTQGATKERKFQRRIITAVGPRFGVPDGSHDQEDSNSLRTCCVTSLDDRAKEIRAASLSLVLPGFS